MSFKLGKMVASLLGRGAESETPAAEEQAKPAGHPADGPAPTQEVDMPPNERAVTTITPPPQTRPKELYRSDIRVEADERGKIEYILTISHGEDADPKQTFLSDVFGMAKRLQGIADKNNGKNPPLEEVALDSVKNLWLGLFPDACEVTYSILEFFSKVRVTHVQDIALRPGKVENYRRCLTIYGQAVGNEAVLNIPGLRIVLQLHVFSPFELANLRASMFIHWSEADYITPAKNSDDSPAEWKAYYLRHELELKRIKEMVAAVREKYPDQESEVFWDHDRWFRLRNGQEEQQQAAA
jgi:hypothetical protein